MWLKGEWVDEDGGRNVFIFLFNDIVFDVGIRELNFGGRLFSGLILGIIGIVIGKGYLFFLSRDFGFFLGWYL